MPLIEEIEISRFVSPLRYPGGKWRLTKFISKALELNNIRPTLFLEPFAGGANVAISLLLSNKVDKIALGEKDPYVSDFWKVVVNDSSWLIDAITEVEITVAKWRYFKNGTFSDPKDRALACLFLNRTSFSGIIASGAGPIGGYQQKSDYSIDCRFPKETIIGRIKAIEEKREKISFVYSGDWKDSIKKARESSPGGKLVVYLDPPFYHKSSRLYRETFSDKDHTELKDFLQKMTEAWILSYDNAEFIRNLYSQNGSTLVERVYSISGSQNGIKANELIVSNLEKLPV